MRSELLPRSLVLTVLCTTIVTLASVRTSVPKAFHNSGQTQGSLQVLDSSGKPKSMCPLKHTDVKAEITGFISRVQVTQEFENPFKEKIEAVYTFPLPQNAAVDDMTMTVGERIVRGKILRREEAQAVYEAAKSAGQVASLLDQERPNIFTQSVANIMPGEQIKVVISYVETLKYEDGSYEFVFPMVVGPRYIPGAATANAPTRNTDLVPDASRITPPLVPDGMRVGHDISIDVTLDAGVPVEELTSRTQAIDVERSDIRQAHVRLKNNSVIPNKDFILRYDVAGKRIEDALLTHRSQKGGFFTLILQPPERVTAEDVTPKEIVFVLDTSGSMQGFPIEKAKETMKLAMDNLYPADTFNLITFSGDTHILFPEPVPATPENLKKAQSFLAARTGSGGTEMMKAISAALDPSDSQNHLRVVCFMTDGYVGNDMEIISEVQKHPNARVFAFGIGGSVNRFLLDKMAEFGRGDVEYVGLNDDGSAAARRFHERVRNPLLTDISVDWGALPLADVYPKRIPDLFGARPVVLTGRYTSGGNGVIRLNGKMSGRPVVREIPVVLPEKEDHNDVLASLWARLRIDDLMSQDYLGIQRGSMRPDVKETITNLGLEYRLMTQFTSFVAVEEMVVTDGGKPRRVDVPIEVPEGVNREQVEEERPSGTLAGFSGGLSFARIANMPTLSVSQTVNVTAEAETVRIDKSRTDTTTVIDRKIIESGGGTAAGPLRSKPKSGAGNGSPSATPPPNTAPAVATSAYQAQPKQPLSAEEIKAAQLRTKLHPSLLALTERLKKKDSVAAAEETKFVRDGKAEVQIWLSDKSPETVAKLKELGFEVLIDPTTSKLIIGRLPVENIEKLVALTFVRYVRPQMSGS